MNYVLIHIGSAHHLPNNLPLSTFFPALAMLLYLVEPLTTPTQVGGDHSLAMTGEQGKLLQEVLAVFSKAYR